MTTGSNEGLTLRLTIDGHRHEFRLGDYNAVEARLFRREMGTSLQRVFRDGEVDIDVIAALWWLQIRRTKPQTTYEDVAEGFTYDDLRASQEALDAADAAAVVELPDEGDPEASGVG